MSTVPGVAFRPDRSTRFAFTSVNLSGGYFPGWGLPCSLVFHQIPLILAIFLSTLPTPPPPSPPPPPTATLKPRPHIQWMYFPKLPTATQAPPEVGTSSSGRRPSPAPGSAANGLTYPGPQEIVSDPPDPTNDIQTLIQPALQKAPILEPPLALPNLVLMADAGLAPPPRPIPSTVEAPAEEAPKPDPLPEPPVPKPEPPAPINVSKVVATAPLPLKPAESLDLVVSPPTPQNLPETGEAKLEPPAPAPEKAAAEVPKTEAASARAEQLKEPEAAPATDAAGGSDVETVVALTPIPSASEAALRIPLGEARGRFAISPKPNLTAPRTETPATTTNPSKPAVVGIDTPSAATPKPTGDAAPGNPPAAVTISFGSGPAVKASGTGAGRNGPGSGFTVAPGRSSFAGITVTGGAAGTGGTRTTPVEQPRRPLQTSYGVSVISTESSGGGLPSFGLFSNHDIYTVYVDMRETETDANPSWTLEVAVAQEPGVPGNTAKNIAAGRGLVLPFPAVKKQPVFPPDVVQKNLRKMIVVYAVISAEGKMERLSVKQTPDPVLGDRVVLALSEWVFRPAVRNGTAFPVEILLGIPVWSGELPAPPKHVSISTTPPS